MGGVARTGTPCAKLPKMAVKSTKSILWCLLLTLATGFCARSAWALGEEPKSGETITQYLTPAILEEIFPGADKVGEVTGTPPAAAVFKGNRQLGYLFSTWDVVQSKGFSSRPLVLLVGKTGKAQTEQIFSGLCLKADRKPEYTPYDLSPTI